MSMTDDNKKKALGAALSRLCVSRACDQPQRPAASTVTSTTKAANSFINPYTRRRVIAKAFVRCCGAGTIAPPANLPSMEKPVIQLMRLFFSFEGRLSRSTVWWTSVLLSALTGVLFVFLESTLGREATWVLYPPFFWALAALWTKRLHDRDQSAWRLLWMVIPILGPLLLFIGLYLRGGTPGDNSYGDDHRLVQADYLTVGS